MAQMNVDDLVKLLDSFSQKGGASIKPEFDGEKANFVGFHGMVAEELAEFGAYMMMYQVVKRVGDELTNRK